MSRIKKGYKVVCCVGKNNEPIQRDSKQICGLMSYVLAEGVSIYKGLVSYSVNKWTSYLLNCGPLAVFECLEDAQNFLLTHFPSAGLCQIWECEYVPSRSKYRYFRWFRDCWDKTTVRSYRTFPPGTILASKVRLIKRVKI